MDQVPEMPTGQHIVMVGLTTHQNMTLLVRSKLSTCWELPTFISDAKLIDPPKMQKDFQRQFIHATGVYIQEPAHLCTLVLNGMFLCLYPIMDISENSPKPQLDDSEWDEFKWATIEWLREHGGKLVDRHAALGLHMLHQIDAMLEELDTPENADKAEQFLFADDRVFDLRDSRF